MNAFKTLHPSVLLVYFVSLLTVSMFSFNPIFLVFALLGAVLYTAVTDGARKTVKSILTSLLIVLAVAVTNPLFSHNGATAILFIDDNRITLEALIYGVVLGLAIAVALMWLHSLRMVFDSEKILYLFGRVSPKTALVISMAMNFVPGFVRRFRSVNSAQKSLPMPRLKRYLSSFSAVVTQSLEDAIITSDSMRARGYGSRKRTVFSRYRFTALDFMYLVFILLLTALTAFPTVTGQVGFTYYPIFQFPAATPASVAACAAFALLAVLPFFYETKEEIKWKYSISKI